MQSKRATSFPGTLGFFLLSLTLAGCTLALDTTAVQCHSDNDCQGAKSGAGSLVCRHQVCVVEANGAVPDSDASASTGGTNPPDAGMGSKPSLPFAVDDAFFTSGYMGDGEQQLITEHACPTGQRGGEGRGRCHEFVYTTGPTAKGWGGLYWQYPANNWDTGVGYAIPPGAKSVAFYAWASATEPAVTFAVGISKADGFEVHSAEIALSPSPRRYVIDIGAVSYADVAGAFSFSTLAPRAGSFKIYLDDIVWSDEPARVATTFAVDTNSAPLASGCGMHLRGSFDDWGDGVVMQDDDKDGVYEVSVELAPNRDVQYRFATACDGGSVDEALSSNAMCAPASGDGAPARVAKVPHESSRVALTCLAACGACPVSTSPRVRGTHTAHVAPGESAL